MKVVNVQGPIQRSHFDSGAMLEIRCSPMLGVGRELVDMIMLPSRPGPHQRSCQPADSIQLPSTIPR